MRKNDVIRCGEDTFTFLGNAVPNARESFATWSAPVEDQNGNKFFMKYAYQDEKEAVSILQRESQFQMHYPYIEHVYGMREGINDKEEDLYCVLVEYIDGKTLQNVVAEAGYTDEKMFRHMLQLLHGVAYYVNFWKNDPLIHRDLKPENLMIAKNGDYLVIIDFDWAHIHGNKNTIRDFYERRYAVGGTKGYMDPRAARGGKSDIKMDIYALGRLFCFWMMKGKDYFSEEEKTIYYEKGQEDLAYGLEIEKRFHKNYKKSKYRELWKIIAKMVAPEEKRYGNISTIILDLKKFLCEIYPEAADFQKLFGEERLLEIPADFEADEDKKKKLCVSWKNAKKKKTAVLFNYSMRDIFREYEEEQRKELLMTIYNLDGELHYIPYKETIRKGYGKESYQIFDGDIICDDEYEYIFRVFKAI